MKSDNIMKQRNNGTSQMHNLRLSQQRAAQKEQGFFDGRFVSRSEDSARTYSRKQKHKNFER